MFFVPHVNHRMFWVANVLVAILTMVLFVVVGPKKNGEACYDVTTASDTDND